MKSIKDRYWKRPLPIVPTAEIVDQAGQLKVSPEIIQLLHNRGIKDTEAIKTFLYPSLQDLDPPLAMSGISAAVEIVYDVIENNGEIIIWGDYDVDGITATSLLVLFFRNVTKKIQWFIPNRFVHGYGLHGPTLKEIIENCKTKEKVLITVDCGIQSHKEVELVQSMGCKVIVTDHHEPGEHAVTADALINPKQEDCNFADDTLAGVGLAFYLAAGVRAYYREKGVASGERININLKQYLDLVAIGTIADMVSLQGCNRVLVRAGFEVLNSHPNRGVAALLAECDIHSGNITSEDISYQIAPKINAAGRLAEASLAVELFLEEDEVICRKIARRLTKLNNKRKEECFCCIESTLTNIDNIALERDRCIIEKVDNSLGILGIVASQIVEKMQVPVIIVTEIEDEKYGKVLKGSCRSVDGINLFKILEQCSGHLLQHGGHEMAAGLSILPEKYDIFKNCFTEIIKEIPKNKPTERYVDIELSIEKALSPETIKDLRLLEPFGVDNEKPKFFEKNIILKDIRRIGSNGDHITFENRGKYSNNKCVAFGFGDCINTLKEKPLFDVVYTISLSRFKKAEKWQACLVDII
jgi:single-stranded-DNA-specific exonuclease